MPTGYYNPQVIRNVDKIVKIKENLYYAKVQDSNFKTLEHNLNTETNFDFEKYKNIPIEQWPEHKNRLL